MQFENQLGKITKRPNSRIIVPIILELLMGGIIVYLYIIHLLDQGEFLSLIGLLAGILLLIFIANMIFKSKTTGTFYTNGMSTLSSGAKKEFTYDEIQDFFVFIDLNGFPNELCIRYQNEWIIFGNNNGGSYAWISKLISAYTEYMLPICLTKLNDGQEIRFTYYEDKDVFYRKLSGKKVEKYLNIPKKELSLSLYEIKTDSQSIKISDIMNIKYGSIRERITIVSKSNTTILSFKESSLSKQSLFFSMIASLSSKNNKPAK